MRTPLLLLTLSSLAMDLEAENNPIIVMPTRTTQQTKAPSPLDSTLHTRMTKAIRGTGVSAKLYNFLQFAQNTAYKAGDIMRNYFGTSLTVEQKEDISPVTKADEEINNLVIHEVEKAYPTHSILGEEGSVRKPSEYAWVCDPIDGTIPFICGIPVSVFSLALVKDGTPIVGVVYDPYTNKMYTAVKGGGAYCNATPIHVSNKTLEKGTYVDSEWSPNTRQYDVETPFHDLTISKNVYSMRIGSVIQACCKVASGEFAAVSFSGVIEKNMDIAAVKVIVEEAGGKVTDLFGNEQRYDGDINGALITNGLVHDEIVAHLEKYLKNLKEPHGK